MYRREFMKAVAAGAVVLAVPGAAAAEEMRIVERSWL